jgi:hypothetical protein
MITKERIAQEIRDYLKDRCFDDLTASVVHVLPRGVLVQLETASMSVVAQVTSRITTARYCDKILFADTDNGMRFIIEVEE